MQEAHVSSDGEVTIPKKIRQQFGINTGSSVSFHVIDNHIELWVSDSPVGVLDSGFGMLKSNRKAVSADFDPVQMFSS